jgi:phosphatidylserine decarboxylase
MKIHKEGFRTIIITFAALAIICGFLYVLYALRFFIIAVVAAFLFWLYIMRFFRMPYRPQRSNPQAVFSPCDGRIVIIDKVFEPEYLKEEVLQISVFMSPNNVHANWYPVSGIVEYMKYHKGKYLVAWHPKSSTLNERTTVVINSNGGRVLVRQIAGFVARRIVCYAKAGAQAQQNTQFGFIKFGSRVDVFLPLNVTVNVQMGQKVVGSQSILAYF